MPPRHVTVRPWLAAIVVAAMLALPLAAFIVGGKLNDNCQSIHRVVVAGERILDAETQLQYGLDHGLISRAQYEEQLARFKVYRPLTERNLDIWRSGDCEP